ncbi:MAG: DUF1573 domain-containing protein [Elusimicrobia bacterium]|nr:DUF1573 domain-containing protein [Elusimicrobiota bacterium]
MGPDDAKITAEFTVRNTGQDMVPLTGVQPSCGCTASDFEPAAVASNEETKIHLTFNTRGYAGTSIHKSAKVKTDLPENEYTVFLAGQVAVDAPVMPEGSGVAEFLPDAASKKTTVSILNKTQGDLTLAMVQRPAEWATVKIPTKPAKAGEKIELEISVDGSVKEQRNTSVTLAQAGATDQNRVTIAIRTGPPPMPYRKLIPPAPAAEKPKAPAAEKSKAPAAPKTSAPKKSK